MVPEMSLDGNPEHIIDSCEPYRVPGWTPQNQKIEDFWISYGTESYMSSFTEGGALCCLWTALLLQGLLAARGLTLC